MLFAPDEMNSYERLAEEAERIWRTSRPFSEIERLNSLLFPFTWITRRDCYRYQIERLHTEEIMTGQAFGL
jgi:hypothetical protein